MKARLDHTDTEGDDFAARLFTAVIAKDLKKQHSTGGLSVCQSLMDAAKFKKHMNKKRASADLAFALMNAYGVGIWTIPRLWE